MKFPKWLRKPPAGAASLYARAVAAGRAVELFRDLGVPDTPDGRFDTIAIHVHLLLRRLGREGEAGAELAQSLFDLMFADMDQNLREMGVGDLSVGKRVKALATSFYGRVAAYDAGLDADDAVLHEALRRNLYRRVAATAGQVEAVGAYMRSADRFLAAQDFRDISMGEVAFPSIRRPAEESKPR